MPDFRTPARVVLLAAAMAIAGCSAASGPDGSRSPAAPAPSGSSGRTSLTVRVDDGRGTTTTWHLTCDPDGGDHPDPAAACAALGKGGARNLPAVPANVGCAEIYGGPEKARITGTWQGKPVDATLSRTDGCQIARWAGLSGLLPAGGA